MQVIDNDNAQLHVTPFAVFAQLIGSRGSPGTVTCTSPASYDRLSPFSNFARLFKALLANEEKGTAAATKQKSL
jgi:hypothetical protein